MKKNSKEILELHERIDVLEAWCRSAYHILLDIKYGPQHYSKNEAIRLLDSNPIDNQ